MRDENRKAPSLTRLYEAYFHELERYVRVKFGQGPPEPEDVANTAFTNYASAAKRSEIRNPRAFLYATARNIVIDHKRRQRTKDAHANDILASGGTDKSDGITPERVLIEKERFGIMRSAILSLPEKERRILLMHRLQSRSYADIARSLAISESSVRRAVARALAHIDEAMKSKGA